jgi:hypothetical protein
VHPTAAIADTIALHDRLLAVNASLVHSSRSYAERTREQLAFVDSLSTLELSLLLSAAGYIPEEFPHDGVEEKCYARSMEVLVCGAFCRLGFAAHLCTARGGNADLLVEGNPAFGVDTKATRFSCPPIHTKCLKVATMSEWKPAGGYALLIGPLFAFPTQQRSRTYREAAAHGIAILAYPHLAVLLSDRRRFAPDGFLSFLAALDQSPFGGNLTGNQYNAYRDEQFCLHTGVALAALQQSMHRSLTAGYQSAEQKQRYYAAADAAVSTMSREELEARVRRELDADRKIGMIERRMARILQTAEQLAA